MGASRRILQLSPIRNRVFASATPFWTPCRPLPIPIGLASHKVFSSTPYMANLRQKRLEEIDRYTQYNHEMNHRITIERKKRLIYGLLVAMPFVWGLAYWVKRQQDAEDPIFVPNHFMQFMITNREYVSSTAFILTLRPQQGPSNRTTVDPYKEDWESGSWTVGIGQPEMQIARPYTPLPPSGSSRPEELRILIRKVDGGELSTYLSRSPIGALVPVEHGMPAIGTKELLYTSDIVFLAGGTGIATAMQLAYGLYEGKQRQDGGPKMHIVWANRKREDCEGGGQNTGPVMGGGKQDPIVAQLEALRQKNPDRLSVEYVVDEERTFIDERKIQQLAKPFSSPEGPFTKVLIICGSDGFVRYLTGSSMEEDLIRARGRDLHSGEYSWSDVTRVSGGVLSRVNISGWDVLKHN